MRLDTGHSQRSWADAITPLDGWEGRNQTRFAVHVYQPHIMSDNMYSVTSTERDLKPISVIA